MNANGDDDVHDPHDDGVIMRLMFYLECNSHPNRYGTGTAGVEYSMYDLINQLLLQQLS